MRSYCTVCKAYTFCFDSTHSFTSLGRPVEMPLLATDVAPMWVQAKTVPYAETRRLALLVAAVLPTLKWRVHDIGLLQACLTDHDDKIQVHIWDEASLAQADIGNSGAKHDHRFCLDSTILTGELTHVEYKLIPSARGAYTHALTEQRYDAERTQCQMRKGVAYTFPRGVFHSATATAGTVTLVTARSQDSGAQARILTKEHIMQPRHAFKRQVSEAAIKAIVADAITRLSREYAVSREWGAT